MASENSLILVAELEGDVAGALNFNGSDHLQCRHSGAFTVTVAKQHRSKGVGTALVQGLLAWAKKHETVSRVSLEVFSNNPGGIRLYDALGFVTEGIKRKAVIVKGEAIDVVQMAWTNEPQSR